MNIPFYNFIMLLRNVTAQFAAIMAFKCEH
jgi:hypothetical protein